jgi:hypothetical protein
MELDEMNRILRTRADAAVGIGASSEAVELAGPRSRWTHPPCLDHPDSRGIVSELFA